MRSSRPTAKARAENEDKARRCIVDAVRQLKANDEQAARLRRDRQHWQNKLDRSLAELDRVQQGGEPNPSWDWQAEDLRALTNETAP